MDLPKVQSCINCSHTWTESFLSSLGRIRYVYTHFWYLRSKNKHAFHFNSSSSVETFMQ